MTSHDGINQHSDLSFESGMMIRGLAGIKVSSFYPYTLIAYPYGCNPEYHYSFDYADLVTRARLNNDYAYSLYNREGVCLMNKAW